MTVQTGWLVTDAGDGGDTFVTPTLEKGVLRVEGRVYRFHNVFPQYTTRETLWGQFVEGVVDSVVGEETAGCLVFCGERNEPERIEALFGKTPLMEKRASFTDGAVIRTVRALSERLAPHQTLKFSFSCLKENGTSPVDLLKNISPTDGVPAPPVPGENAHLNCRYLVAPTPSDLIWSLNRVLQSPSFMKHSLGLTLCLTLAIHTQNSTRETILTFLDVTPIHMAKYSFLDSIDKWRRLAAPDPIVPSVLTYPLRTSAKVSVLVSHPGSLTASTSLLLQQLSQFNTPQSPRSPVGTLVAPPTRSESRQLSPQLSPRYVSPRLSPRKVIPDAGRLSPINPSSTHSISHSVSVSQPVSDWEVAKLKKHLEHSDKDIDRMAKTIVELERQLESKAGLEVQLQTLQCQLRDVELGNEQRSLEVHIRFDKELEAKEQRAMELEQVLRERDGEFQMAVATLEGRVKELERRCDDANAELGMKDNELLSRDSEVDMLRTRLREAQLKGDELAGRELALRDTEKELDYEKERLNQEAESRLRVREAQLMRQHEAQLHSEQAARRRAVSDLEHEREALVRQLEAKDEELNRETAHLEETIRSQATQLEHRNAEVNRLRAQIAEVRKEEARRVTQDIEQQMDETLRIVEEEKKLLEHQLEEATVQMERDMEMRQQQFDTDVSNMSLQITEQEAVIQQMEDERQAREQRHKVEFDEVRAMLKAERASNEEARLSEVEQQSKREAELCSETSRVRSELAHSQAELLKASRALEDKELELQGLTRLSQEVEEVRQRNAELERLLRESQHYGRSQQMKRELDVAMEIMESLRMRLVPSWCSDWARLGRLKDLKEHLVVRAEELTSKVRELETSEREQRVREVALVGEHETSNLKMREMAKRAAVAETRYSELETEVSVLRTNFQNMATTEADLRRIVESLGGLILSPLEGEGLKEGWAPTVDLEVWLSNSLRQVKYERDKFRDLESDKQHALQELQVRYAALEAENEIVNQNVKEMTNQIIGVSVGFDSPSKGLDMDNSGLSLQLDKTSVEVATMSPSRKDMAPVPTPSPAPAPALSAPTPPTQHSAHVAPLPVVSSPISIPAPVHRAPMVLSPYITSRSVPVPLPASVRDSVDRYRSLSTAKGAMQPIVASARTPTTPLFSPRTQLLRP